MSSANNLFNIKINSTSDGFVNFGNAVNINMSSKEKEIGGSEPVGDFAGNVAGGCNAYLDPDIIDMLRIKK
jgi:hypothetical protein